MQGTVAGVDGELVTWEITKGANKISVSPQSATTAINGKAGDTFYSGDLKKSVKVNVKY